MKNLTFITLNKKNIYDFAKERNDLLRKSKAGWIFFVDSDEKMSAELRNEALDCIQDTNFDGFYVYRKNYFLGRYVGTDKILRLARRTAGKWARSVHETWLIRGNIGQLKNPLIHTTADSLHDFIAKINYYSTLHAKENLKAGKRSNLGKILFFPIIKFIQSILIGRGFMMSMLQSLHSFLAWSKEWTLQNA